MKEKLVQAALWLCPSFIIVHFTLKWVNGVREEIQARGPLKRMPKGRRLAPSSCPIANALNSEWDATVGARHAHLLPPWVLKQQLKYTEEALPHEISLTLNWAAFEFRRRFDESRFRLKRFRAEEPYDGFKL